MKFYFQHFLRATIIATFALLFIKLHLTGEIYKYINPKYDEISQVAAAIFIFFFFIQLFRVWGDHQQHTHTSCDSDCDHDHGHDHGYSASLPKKLVSYVIILFPLVIGFSFAPAVLDSSIAANKEIMFQVHDHHTGDDPDGVHYGGEFLEEQHVMMNDQLLEHDETLKTRQLEDKEMEGLDALEVIEMDPAVFEPYYVEIGMDPHKYEGRKIKLTGFVYKEQDLASNQAIVSRFLVTHCVADAGIIGFVTEFQQEVDTLKQDTWVELEGTLSTTIYNELELPMIRVDQWKVIERPDEPYVYPVFTKSIE